MTTKCLIIDTHKNVGICLWDLCIQQLILWLYALSIFLWIYLTYTITTLEGLDYYKEEGYKSIFKIGIWLRKLKILLNVREENMAKIIKFMLNHRVSVNPDKEFIPFILVFWAF